MTKWNFSVESGLRIELTEPEDNSLSSAETPFITPTLAEIFIRQGHVARGLAIYQDLLNDNPMNSHYLKRIGELTAELQRGSNGFNPVVGVRDGDSMRADIVGKEGLSPEAASSEKDVLAHLNQWLAAIRERKQHV